ncbi:hypothetical protein D3C87_1902900 [compost metagenome]
MVVLLGGSGINLSTEIFLCGGCHPLPFSHGKEVAAMCEVRKPVIGTRPDKSLPAHSRHNAFTVSG